MTLDEKVSAAMEAGKPVTARWIARHALTGERVGAVRGALQRLEAAGCVRRHPAKSDGSLAWELLRRPSPGETPRRHTVRGVSLAPLPWAGEAAQ